MRRKSRGRSSPPTLLHNLVPSAPATNSGPAVMGIFNHLCGVRAIILMYRDYYFQYDYSVSSLLRAEAWLASTKNSKNKCVKPLTKKYVLSGQIPSRVFDSLFGDVWHLGNILDMVYIHVSWRRRELQNGKNPVHYCIRGGSARGTYVDLNTTIFLKIPSIRLPSYVT